METTAKRRRRAAQMRKENAYLAALHEVTLGLINRLDREDVLQNIVERATQLLGTSHGYLYLVEPKAEEIVVRVGTGVFTGYIGFRMQLGEGLAGRVWQTGQPLIVNDYDAWPGRSPKFDFQVFHAALGVPLKSRARVVGVIGMVHVEPELKFGRDEAEMLSRFAQLASIALDNARLYTTAQQELRDSETRYRGLFERVPVGLYRTTPAGAIVDVNPALLKIFGYPDRATLLRQKSTDLYANPEDRRRWQERLERAGLLHDFEVRARRRDGQTIWVRESTYAVRDESDQVIYYEGVVEDITARKQVEAALRQSEELFSKAFRTSPIAITISALRDDGYFHYIDVNDRFLSLTGYHWEEVIGRTTIELGLWARIASREQIMRLLDQTGVARDVEVDWLTKSGQIRNILATMEALDFRNQRCIITFALNVTERKEAMEELRRSRGQFETILQGIADGVTAQDAEGRLVFANDAVARLAGYPSAYAMVQDPPRDFFARYELSDEQGRPLTAEQLPTWQALCGVAHPSATVCWRNRISGETRWSIVKATPICDDQGQVRLTINIIQDITELKHAQEELKRLAEARQALASKILNAQEQERRLIAQELHDALGQMLTVLKMDIDWMAQHIDQPETLAGLAAGLGQKCDEAIDLVRNLAYELHPAVLDDLGIGAALETLVAEISRRSKIRCKISVSSKVQCASPTIATTVYRIAQEALTNIVRHSDAQQAWISLRKRGDSLMLRVADDGRGIPPERLKDWKSLGIQGMRERALLLDGALTIDARQGGGTVVTARIPCTGGAKSATQDDHDTRRHR